MTSDKQYFTDSTEFVPPCGFLLRDFQLSITLYRVIINFLTVFLRFHLSKINFRC